MYLSKSSRTSVPPYEVGLEPFGPPNLFSGRLRSLLHEPVCQNQSVATMIKAQYAICVATEVHPTLPNLISRSQLLEVLDRNRVQFLEELEYPSHLLGNFGGQQIKELGYWTLSFLSLVEDERPSHG